MLIEPELESLIWADPDLLGLCDYTHLGRQVRLPSGLVMDIFGVMAGPRLVITELKARPADGDAIEQVLHYVVEIVDIIQQQSDLLTPEGYDPLWLWDSKEHKLLEPLPVIVASSFSRRTLAAAMEAQVCCIQYRDVIEMEVVEYDCNMSPNRDRAPSVQLAQMLRSAALLASAAPSAVQEGGQCCEQ